MDIEQLIEFFKFEITKEITHTRFAHSLRVAEISEKLCISLGYPNPRKAYLAGVLHDITKQKKDDFHIAIFEKHGFDFKEIPPRAWHPHSGVFYLQDEYNFQDKEVLSAIKNHTLGGKNLSLLDKIIYTADFLGSDYIANRPELNAWINQTSKDINQGIILKSSNIIRELLAKKEKIHALTLDTYNSALEA